MIISGLQKMTLLDYPGKVACTVFLQGCNFRCPFCHNSDLLGANAQPAYTEDELLAFLRSRRGLLDAVCISGGEPTLSPELPALLRKIRALGYLTKLDTNGSRPDVLAALIGEGLLDYVAMDVKNAPSCYAPTCGTQRSDLSSIEESLRLLMTGDTAYELRTTLVHEMHDAASIEEMGRWLAGLASPHLPRALYLQPFVDRDSVLFSGLNPPSPQDIALYVEILRSYTQHVALRGE